MAQTAMNEPLASLDAAISALDRGEPCPTVSGLSDEQRDRLLGSGMLKPWLTSRRATLAHIAGLPSPKRSATGYALWSALSRDQIARCDAKDAGRLQARGQDRIPENNPVIARLAAQAGITIDAWFEAVR